MTADVAYVQLYASDASRPSAHVTVGLYPGMTASELELVVKAALKRSSGSCAGFLVASEAPETPRSTRSGRKKKSAPRTGGGTSRIVPLSLACLAPELLRGRVSVLMTPSTMSEATETPVQPLNGVTTARGHVEATGRGSTTASSRSGVEFAGRGSANNGINSNGSADIRRLLEAIRTEQELSRFQSETLAGLYEQYQGPGSTDDASASQWEQMTPPRRSGPVSSQMPREQDEDKLHAEILGKTVARIGRRVFSPLVQAQVLTLATQCRSRLTKSSAQPLSGVRYSNLMELLAVVEGMLDKHALPEEHCVHLLELILDENRILFSALHSYKTDRGSLAELETTAKRLAALGCEPLKAIASNGKKKNPKKVVKQKPVKADSSGSPARKRFHSVADAAPSAVAVVRSLHHQQMLTTLELDILQALVAQNDSQVLQVLREFEQGDNSDVAALRDALVAIVEEITMELGDEEKAAAAFALGVSDAVQDGEQEEDSDDEEDDLAWQRHVRYLIGQWRAQGVLAPADAMTLRRMVTQRHNLLESAYEVFAGDGDASELLDTLQRVAKLQRQVEQTHAARGFPSEADSSTQQLRLEDVVREMQRRDLLQAGDAAGLLVLFHGGNEALQAANEAFQADGDVRELEETLLLVVKHARFGGGDSERDEEVDEVTAIARLLVELATSGRLEKWQIELLLVLAKMQDPRLLAATDVYNDDENADELVETLEILAELAAWERHRGAMVREWIAPLARSGKLPRGGAERLVQLVTVRDDRVVAALVVFLSDGSGEEFVDTLTRIACLEAAKQGKVASPVSSHGGGRQDEAQEGHVLLTLLGELEDSDMLCGEERELMEALVCSGDPRALAAVDVLAATHDAADFADTTRRILAMSRRTEVEESGDAEAEPVAAASSPKATSVVGRMEKQLLHLTSELQLSETPTQALRKAIAERHEDVEAAVERFHQAKDAEAVEADNENGDAPDGEKGDVELTQKRSLHEAEDDLKEALLALAKRLAPEEGETLEDKEQTEAAE
ncbi:hypothetical protein BBJ28_00012980 [Nothophytophthora sp. Chile5]|nr:hypothetical protein BBJ28_00012980 [Nothophytophthora sp. Chile5]